VVPADGDRYVSSHLSFLCLCLQLTPSSGLPRPRLNMTTSVAV
jgi:hypothetical protein